MGQIHTKYGNVFPIEAKIYGDLDRYFKKKRCTNRHDAGSDKKEEGKQRGQR